MPDVRQSASDTDLELLRSGIRLMALRVLGDADAAEEVAQETLSRAVLTVRATSTTVSLGAYVAGIARHVIADWFRARGRAAPMTTAAYEAVRDDRPDALATLCADEEAVRVRAALAGLGDADRELLTLCYLHDLTPTEVARRLDAPPERIRQRKLRALQRLRAAFDAAHPSRHAGAVPPTDMAGISATEARGSAA